MSEELTSKTISDIYPLIKNKEISPVDLTESLFNRIEKLDGVINSYISTRKEAAISEASDAEQKIQAGEYAGKLHGIPLALKDIFHFKDFVPVSTFFFFHSFSHQQGNHKYANPG